MDYHGFHVGIVVENDDPKYWGRVKVFVPEHAPNLDKLNEWIESGKLPANGNKCREFLFNALDKEISPDLVAILDELKEYLPWAEYAGPIFGGSGLGRFRCATKKTSLNDGPEFGESDAENGFRPLNNFVEDRVNDDFTATNPSTTVVNPNGSDYEPCNYSGMARGIFSIPNVGAQVYVFYLNDDPMYPVYFAASYNPDAIKQIYTNRQKIGELVEGFFAYDYPGDFENSNKDDEASKVFTSKTVLNSNKHTIEMIDTDRREALRIQHFGGGFKEFNNATNIEFAPKNDQKLVKGDSFETVKGAKGISIGGEFGVVIGGNVSTQVGKYSDVKKKLEEELKPELKDLGQILQLFPVRRTRSDMTPMDCSSLQKMEPIGDGFIVCPTCGGVKYDPYKVNGLNTAGTYQDEDSIKKAGKADSTTVTAKVKVGSDDAEYVAQKAVSGDEMSREEYGWSKIPRAVSHCVSLFEQPEAYFKSKPSSHEDYGKVGYIGGIQCPTCNNEFWRKRDSTVEWTKRSGAKIGFSPSTEDGKWKEETARSNSSLYQTYVTKIQNTKDAFKALGDQGEKVERVTMSKTEVIGSVFNDLPSYRVDPIGKLRVDGLFVTQQSTIPYYLPTPHVEPVDVPQVPGGDYTLTVGNKWTVSVGSNGINISTTGRMEFSGGISEIATQELILSSKHDMVIDGGERLMLRARKMTINPVEHNALTVDGQLHVMRNEIVRGGLLVEGETAVQHVTAPGELAVTQTEMYTGGETESCKVNVVLELGLSMEGVGDLIGEAAKEAESTKKKKKCKKWKSWSCFKNSATGQGIMGAVVGGVSGALTGGIAGAIGGAISMGYQMYYQQRGINKIADAYNRQLSGVTEALNGILEFLQGPIDAVLTMPSHKHAFLQIPTSFKDCPNGVRAQLLQPGNDINSRTLILAARRRHHVGAYQNCEKVDNIYQMNRRLFDRAVYGAITAGLPALEGNMVSKGISENGDNEGEKCWAIYGGGYCDGDTGLMAFYTIRDYYNKTTNIIDHAVSTAYAGKMQNVICMVTFKMVGDEDELYSGDVQPSQTDEATGFVVDSISPEMTGSNDYISPGSEKCKAQLLVWRGAYEILGV